MESSSRVNVWNPSASKRATSIASATTSSASPSSEHSRKHSGFGVFALALCLLCSVEGAADTSQPAQLQHALSRLEAREDAKNAKGAIDQARRALQTASRPGADGDTVARAQAIARAAIVLAERQLERRKAQAELFETQRRLNATRARANAQRRALEALMRERASLARGMEQP